jgi:serine/threonine protein kinase
MSSVINLVVVKGPLEGAKFGFDQTMECVIGRSSECVLQIPPEAAVGVSKRHCLLDIRLPDRVAIRDLDSRNGTYLNGVDIRDERERQILEDRKLNGGDTFLLRNDDLFIIGQLCFQVLINPSRLPADEPFSKGTIHLDPDAADSIRNQSLPSDVSPHPVASVDGTGSIAADESRFLSQRRSERRVGTSTLRKIAKVETVLESSMFIENFHVEKQIGKGGMGLVYQVRNLKNGSIEALKLLTPEMALSDEEKERFNREISLLRELNHPNIVKIIETGIAQGTFYFTLEYCDRGNIEDLMVANKAPLVPEEAVKIVLQCLTALDYAHGKSVVHCDIKPENIFLKSKGKSSFHVKVGDFGVAKAVLATGIGGDGFVMGTPEFISRQNLLNPEQIGPASDLWSLTATLYYMLSGYVPREIDPARPTESVLESACTPIRQRVPDLSERLAYFIDLALDDKDKLHFQSVKPYRSALLDAI